MQNSDSSFSFSALKKSLRSVAGWKAAAVGALGAFVGIFATDLTVAPYFDFSLGSHLSFGSIMLGQSLLSMVSGAVLSAAILAYDNQAGLRGRWSRDLGKGLLLFSGLSFLSGGLGQLLYSTVGHTRALPWALTGAGIGMGIGLLRRDKIQALRGALGGALGGIIGGLLVDGFLTVSYTDQAFVTASEIGIIITGAMIALFMRVVQDTLRSAWLLGISTGAYEGKEYPLNTNRVTVGKSELNDIALYRETALPPEIGAFVFQNGAWYWQGIAASINGTLQTQTMLQPGDTIQLGSTQFRYQTRSVKEPLPGTALPGKVLPGMALPGAPAPSTSEALPPYAAPPLPQFPPPSPGYGASSYGASANGASPAGISGYQATPDPNQNPPASPYATSAMPLNGSLAPNAYNPLPASSGVNWTLRNVTEPGSTLYLPATGPLRLGRAPQNSLTLADPSVSGVHAEFVVQGAQLVVTDLNSTNGTFVNHQKIAPHTPVLLKAGDHLHFGRLEVIVEAH